MIGAVVLSWWERCLRRCVVIILDLILHYFASCIKTYFLRELLKSFSLSNKTANHSFSSIMVTDVKSLSLWRVQYPHLAVFYYF